MHAKFKVLVLLIPLFGSLEAGSLYRDYSKPLTNSDRQDIRYILTNLSNSSLVTIMYNRVNIERAGDRIDPIHPLNFLLCVFTSYELTAYIHNIKERSLVWKDFYNGLVKSLQTESSEYNLNEYVSNFALQLHLKPQPLIQASLEKNWDKFLNILLTQVPRNPDRDRYGD